jgi:hypothetical protein
LEQRLEVVKRIEAIFKEAGLAITVNWDAALDFPLVEPLSQVEKLSPDLKKKYLLLVNRMIEVIV